MNFRLTFFGKYLLVPMSTMYEVLVFIKTGVPAFKVILLAIMTFGLSRVHLKLGD